MIKDTLQNAVDSINKLNDECEQLQQDNDTLTDSIKKLEDEQREGYKTFNTDSHVLLEKHVINQLINDIDDCYMSCDDAQDYCSQVQSDLENLDTYTIEEAYDRTRSAKDEASRVSQKLQDVLSVEDVEPLTQEGVENA